MPELDIDQWLKPADVKPKAELEFTDAGESGLIHNAEGEPSTKTFEIGVKFIDGSKRKWTMNKTSQRAVATLYGTNTDNWVGKIVEAFVVPQNVRGTMKDVIYARIPGPKK